LRNCSRPQEIHPPWLIQNDSVFSKMDRDSLADHSCHYHLTN
jgi:hypothetical protein